MTQEHVQSQRRRTYGIRFSRLDGVVLCGTFATAAVSWADSIEFCVLLLFVVVHFFLFCNIFRIRRVPELIWAAVFLANCCVWSSFYSWPMLPIGCTQAAITVCILAWEVSRPCYHGIFARALNPSLEHYLSGQS